MKLKNMTPVKLRIILALSLIILSILGIGMFAFGYGQLKLFVIAAQDVAAKAQSSQSSVQDLVATKKFLQSNADAINRANQLAAESMSYVYQDQVINDINKYASEAGLAITNIAFTTPTTTAVGGTTAPPVTGSAATTAAPAGVKSMTANVTIKNPTNYLAMLDFIHLIEQSLFRMQISQIGISASSDDKNPNQVSSDILTIEVYVR
ncbi:MAG TPA: hypothetical protein VLF64_00035 [Candidatus Saccharimonadales bacterium]|nr:hypothetical protein [Candidatus Saccharimonadales bacterium]